MSDSTMPPDGAGDGRRRAGEGVRTRGPADLEVEGHVARPGEDRLPAPAEPVTRRPAQARDTAAGEDDVEAHTASS